jgi:pantoate--beta-alanine ligase
MGALHAGHLALVDRARREAGRDGLVVVSVFVNPLQFGPKEDLSVYPRPWRRDLAACRAHGVDLVFHPEPADMYAPGQSVFIDDALLSTGLCGRSRPGHFSGVLTVVAKLFNLVRPHAAVFGRKDYQQLSLIRRMVRDLNFPLEVIGEDIVREADGLALSSRNVYLSAAQRAQAPVLRRALLRVRDRVAAGERSAARLSRVLAAELATAPLARVDYAEIVDAEDLQPVKRLDRPVLAALAVFFGRTRLIDNEVLVPAP